MAYNNEYDKDFNNFNNRNNRKDVRDVELGGGNNINNVNNLNNLEIGVNQQPNQPVKKNRTLQFYKFLFYSMKVEIKIHEFYDLIRFSNQSEISIWILSLVLYFNSPADFSNIFVWIHLIHIIRGVIGFLILLKMPRSYNVVEAMKNVPEKEMETKLFNDIARSVVKKEVVEPMERMKAWLIVYFVLTFVNFIFDVIDFLYILANIDKEGMPNNKKVILLSYLICAFIYLAIDFSYVFWTNSLKYTFPETYLEPINQTFSGAFEKLKLRFRLKKKETDIKQEAAIQNQNQNNNIQNNNIDNNNVNPENIHIEIGDKNENHYVINNNNENNQNVKYNYPGNNNHENYLDQIEENLD